MIQLNVTDLELMAHLGWPDDERCELQKISINLTIFFNDPPQAIFSDELADTICYQKIELLLRKQIEHQTFKLLEHLGYRCYELVKKAIPEHTRFHLTVSKYLGAPHGSRSVEFSS